MAWQHTAGLHASNAAPHPSAAVGCTWTELFVHTLPCSWPAHCSDDAHSAVHTHHANGSHFRRRPARHAVCHSFGDNADRGRAARGAARNNTHRRPSCNDTHCRTLRLNNKSGGKLLDGSVAEVQE